MKRLGNCKMQVQRKELFSEKVLAGSRTYFFDVKESTDGTKYLVISESRQVDKESHKHNRVMVFQERISSFAIRSRLRKLGLMKRRNYD